MRRKPESGRSPSSFSRKFFVGVNILLLVIGVAIVVLNPMRALSVLLIALGVSLLVATICYVPTFCYHWAKTRSLHEAHVQTWRFISHFAIEVFSKVMESL